MDFKQLKSFVSVVEYGNFTSAAAKLKISQPTVSTHVQALEDELGRQLMLRTAKRVKLTAYGAKVYEQALAILAMHERMTQSAIYKGETIYLGASSIPASYILPEALMEYRDANPDSRFSISQGASQDIADGVADGMYDVGFTGIFQHDDAIVCMPFCTDRIVLIAPNQAPFDSLDMNEPLDLAEFLPGTNVILREVGSGTRAEIERIFDEAGIDRDTLNVVARLNDQGSIKNLVEHGFGISFASERSVQGRVANGRLLAFRIAGVDSKRNFFILRRKAANLNDATEHFITFMRLRFGGEI